MKNLMIGVLVASFALWGAVPGTYADPVANPGPVESAVLPAEIAVTGEPDAGQEWLVFVTAIDTAMELYLTSALVAPTPAPLPEDPWEDTYPGDEEILEFPDDPWETN